MKKKVLRLIARLNVGGPARHVIWLTAGHRDRYEELLACGHVESNEEEMTGFCRELGVEALHVEGLGRSIGPRDLPAFFRVLALVRRFDPDIIDTHTAKAGLLGRSVALALNLVRTKKIRTVHTFHGHVLHGYFSPAVSRFFLFLERFLGRFATDRIVVISPQQKRELAETYRVAAPDKFRIVPLGMDLSRFRWKERWEAGAEIRVGLVGRLTAIKDPHLFLEAGRLVQEGDPRVKLVVVGDGEMRSELERAAGGGAEFLGNRNDIEALMPTLDVLVLSSRNEGTPMSVLEAFASGVPVVATAAGGCVDLLAEDRGLLSPIGDAQALAANIRRLVGEPELAERMRIRARDYVHERYALKRMLEDMGALYEDLS